MINIGLYSALGRQDVIEARKIIKEKGFDATPEGIRQCRQYLLTLPEDHPAKGVTQSIDFYTISSCRDLLFHFQEHRFSLPEISDLLKKYKLSFIAFEFPDNSIRQIYAEHFPDDPSGHSLKNWTLFEEQFPDTFMGMYQFWAQIHKRFTEDSI